ncbi:HAD-IIB family hydrolase [Odoribacter lunatus]|uniref:HAD-IIB family hydrolase n=1 Tax=Odoribacter lunatus TaxID=2941335 RepID=UPI00204157DC|nr:HAD family hydrolase [Odoribacter lunatus]
MKAIITDLDGTILPQGENISTATINTLKQLGNHHVFRIIATGRTLFAARKFLPDDFPIDYLIFSSGTGIMRWQDKKILVSHHISRKETQDIADYLWNYNINFTIQQEIPDNHYFYYTDIYPKHTDFQRRVEKFQEFGTIIQNSAEIKTAASQIILILHPEQIKLIEKIKKELPGYSVLRSTSPFDYKAIWLEIYPRGINKGYTCRELLRMLHLSGEECAGIGNDYNDTDFLDICAQSYVVANAPEQLKACYKSVASDRNNGFTECVSKIWKLEL